jgi:hypothetical protein
VLLKIFKQLTIFKEKKILNKISVSFSKTSESLKYFSQYYGLHSCKNRNKKNLSIPIFDMKWLGINDILSKKKWHFWWFDVSFNFMICKKWEKCNSWCCLCAMFSLFLHHFDTTQWKKVSTKMFCKWQNKRNRAKSRHLKF